MAVGYFLFLQEQIKDIIITASGKRESVGGGKAGEVLRRC
jgi:hypothetical protein